MSDGLIILTSVFALAILYSATRITVALIGKRSADRPIPRELARRVAELTAQVDQLQLAADAAERELARLGEAQRFAERLASSRHDPASSRPPVGLPPPDLDPPSNVSLHESGDLR